MISELGTVRDITYISSEEEPRENEVSDLRDEPTEMAEVIIGSLFERSSATSDIPKRRIRVRSSNVI